jgi:hypothetical protein
MQVLNEVVKLVEVRGQRNSAGKLYGRINVMVPGYWVGKRALVIVYLPLEQDVVSRILKEEEKEERKRKGVKPKEEAKIEAKPELKPEEKPIEEIEVKPEAKFELKPEDALKLLEELDRERRQKELANSLGKYLARRGKIGDLDV